jgi:hypothetical protein
MDDEIKKLTDEQYHRAIKIIADNKDKVLALANQLLEREVIFKEDLEKIFGMSASDAIAKKLLDDQLIIADTATIIEETMEAVEAEEIGKTTAEISEETAEN